MTQNITVTHHFKSGKKNSQLMSLDSCLTFLQGLADLIVEPGDGCLAFKGRYTGGMINGRQMVGTIDMPLGALDPKLGMFLKDRIAA